MADDSDSPLRELEQAVPGNAPEGIDDTALLTSLRRELRQFRRRTTPKTSQYLQPTTGQAVGRTSTGRFAFSTEFLRNIRWKSPLVQAIHATRDFQMGMMSAKWSGSPESVGWRVVHKDHHDNKDDVPDEIKPFIKLGEQLLERPDPRDCPTMRSLLSQLWEDLATINRPVVEVLYSDFDSNIIVGFTPVDGALIWPTIDYLKHWCRQDGGPRSQEEALRQLEQVFRADLGACDYVLVQDGVVLKAYPKGTLIVAPMVNMTDVKFAGWPASYVEKSLASALANLDAWNYNHNYFTKGFLPELLIALLGDFEDEDEEAFVDELKEAGTGVERAHQVPVVRSFGQGTIEKIDLKKNNVEMMFESWLSVTGNTAMAVYRIDPSSVGWKPWGGGSSGGLSEANRTTEITIARSEGARGDLEHIGQCILTPLLQRIHPDLRLEWMYADHDPKAASEVDEAEARVSITRNEVRLRRGRKPQGFWLSDDAYDKASPEDRVKHDTNPWNMPTDPSFVQAMSAWVQQQQAPQDDGFGNPMAPGPLPPGQAPPGAPPGGGGGAPGGAPGAPGAPGQPPQGAAPQDDGYGAQRAAPRAPMMKSTGPITVYVVDTPRGGYP